MKGAALKGALVTRKRALGACVLTRYTKCQAVPMCHFLVTKFTANQSTQGKMENWNILGGRRRGTGQGYILYAWSVWKGRLYCYPK